jgi:hypothetical protein
VPVDFHDDVASLSNRELKRMVRMRSVIASVAIECGPAKAQDRAPLPPDCAHLSHQPSRCDPVLCTTNAIVEGAVERVLPKMMTVAAILPGP